MEQSYFCVNCMEKISSYQDICPYCKYRNSQYTAPSHALMPMTVLQGRYLIGRVLGAGGFGITYVARDLKVDKKVCIKEFFVRGSMYREGGTSEQVSLITDGNVSERLYYANMEKFEQEAKILGRFDNVPGIVGVSDYFHENNTAYIVMEFLEGTTLKAYVQSNGGHISWNDLADKLRPVFASLQALHDQGVYHRDISPDNIMLLKDGSLKVFDFGGARIDTDGHGASAMIIRKIGYSPIEQYSRGKQGPWTDVYALAATLYFCLSGKPPADSTDRAGEIDSLESFESLGIKVPKNVEKAIYKGLSVKPDDRFQSMEAFQQALYSEKTVLSRHNRGPSSSENDGWGTAASVSGSGSSGSGKKALIGALIAALLIAAGIGAYFMFLKKDNTGNTGQSGTGTVSSETSTRKSQQTAEPKKAEESRETQGKITETPVVQETQKPAEEVHVIQSVEKETQAAVSETADEKQTEPVTEEITKKQTEPVTEKITEKQTEPVTEKITEKQTEPVTEKITEKQTEPVTEKATRKQTEPVTEKVTEVLTEATAPENEIQYLGSYQVAADGFAINRESGSGSSAGEELSHIEDAETYPIATGKILFVDQIVEYAGKLWGHTNYCGVPGWFVWRESDLNLRSRNDISAQTGSRAHISSASVSLEMRDAPSTSGNVAAIIQNSSQPCELQAVKNGWGQVTIDGNTGWISMSDLTVDVLNALYKVDLTGAVDLLTAPDASGQVLAAVPADSFLYVDQIENGYGKAAYGDYTGWVQMNRLQMYGDETMMNMDQFPRPAETASSMPRDWTMNQLVEEHGAKGDLGESGNVPEKDTMVFGIPEWDRSAVTAIYVRDNLDYRPANTVDLATARAGGVMGQKDEEGNPVNAVDLSAAQDQGVIGWINAAGNLILAGEGGVKAPENGAALFAYYENAEIIDLGGNLHTDNTTDFQYFFYHCEKAHTITTSGMNTSMGTTFIKMFTACKSVQSLDLSTFDTSQSHSFYYMFQFCNALTVLDLRSFATPNVTQYSGMFRDCDNITEIILDPARFDTTQAARMTNMFTNCPHLQRVNVEHFNMRNVHSTSGMFDGCAELTQLNLYGWDLSGVPLTDDDNSNGMFANCPLQIVYGISGEYFFSDREIQAE